jgi:hypothetical protein
MQSIRTVSTQGEGNSSKSTTIGNIFSSISRMHIVTVNAQYESKSNTVSTLVTATAMATAVRVLQCVTHIRQHCRIQIVTVDVCMTAQLMLRCAGTL